MCWLVTALASVMAVAIRVMEKPIQADRRELTQNGIHGIKDIAVGHGHGTLGGNGLCQVGLMQVLHMPSFGHLGKLLPKFIQLIDRGNLRDLRGIDGYNWACVRSSVSSFSVTKTSNPKDLNGMSLIWPLGVEG